MEVSNRTDSMKLATPLPITARNPEPRRSSDPAPDGPLRSKETPKAEPISRRGTASPAHAPKTQTVFIHKLYDMLEDPSLAHLIWWLPAGDSFFVYPGEEFSAVLAQYFKHTNIALFIRQLNMYGFHKVNDSHDAERHAGSSGSSLPATRWEFRHAANQFRKGDVHLLSLIKRKSSKVLHVHKDVVSVKTLPPSMPPTLAMQTMVSSSMPPNAVAASSPSAAAASHANASAHASALATAASHAAHGQHQQADDHEPQQYHRAMYPQPWEQMDPVVYSYPMYAVPGSPGSPGSPSYVHLPLQSQLRQPLVPTPLPVELLINLKLIEMNTTLANVKAGYSELLARHDALVAAYQRSQAELLQLTEVVERVVQGLAVHASATPPDRARTPVGRTPQHDGMSPMSGGSAAASAAQKPTAPAEAPATQAVSGVNVDFASLKQLLAARAAQPPPPAKYHLNDVSLALAKAHNIVPQHYPLNPNYLLYTSPEHFRHFNMLDDLHRAPPGRHVLILMDPLQPMPRGDDHALQQQSQQQQQQQPPQPPQLYHMRREPPIQQRTVSLPIIDKPPAALTPHRHSTTTIPPPRLLYEADERRALVRGRGVAVRTASYSGSVSGGSHGGSRAGSLGGGHTSHAGSISGPSTVTGSATGAGAGSSLASAAPVGSSGVLTMGSGGVNIVAPTVGLGPSSVLSMPSVSSPSGISPSASSVTVPGISSMTLPSLSDSRPLPDSRPSSRSGSRPGSRPASRPASRPGSLTSIASLAGLDHLQQARAKLPARSQLPSVSELDRSLKSTPTGRVYELLLDPDDRSKKRKVET